MFFDSPSELGRVYANGRIYRIDFSFCSENVLYQRVSFENKT